MHILEPVVTYAYSTSGRGVSKYNKIFLLFRKKAMKLQSFGIKLPINYILQNHLKHLTSRQNIGKGYLHTMALDF